MGEMISGIIIARNEERHIEKAIKSLQFCGEVIVIDNDSTDKTASIAKRLKTEVYEYKKIASEGHFGEIRMYAVNKAKGDWILFLDADETISKSLEEEILLKTKQDDNTGAFAMPRRNILLGHEMYHGGWWPDYVLRLIKKEKLKGYHGELHEQPNIEGGIEKLKNPLIHTTHESLREMIEKTNKWSEIEAKLMFDAKHPPMTVSRFITGMGREFWYRAVLKLGFLDGRVGIIEIMYQMFSRFVSYSKLYERQIK